MMEWLKELKVLDNKERKSPNNTSNMFCVNVTPMYDYV